MGLLLPFILQPGHDFIDGGDQGVGLVRSTFPLASSYIAFADPVHAMLLYDGGSLGSRYRLWTTYSELP